MNNYDSPRSDSAILNLPRVFFAHFFWAAKIYTKVVGTRRGDWERGMEHRRVKNTQAADSAITTSGRTQ